ncbi:hypothetical protein ACRE_007790 [Hapsidospora chrysogenum ATCC 11550]|uniref:Uncharacterized protein n=1 Tax=Hapsidospora chrysogenum (strain ATCC 11550 / CBS 779.69 / DSM 880 / IAM 14645 / JCM 23072 / IMI 49137) TaxID=857340 RepID=A0A086TFR9_HAPC1|nr:hypothetical protein ACRE_007790 [Hapsidospora chrysogenum ATCC 11550]
MIPATSATVVRAAVQRRSFSLASSFRAMARAMESHPFERLPVTQKSAAADWAKQVKRVTSQAAICVPGVTLFFGWPLLVRRVANPGASYEIPESMKLGYERD